MLANLAGFGVEPDEQFVSQGDAHDFGRLAGGSEPLLEEDEVGLVTADYAGDDEQDFADRSTASAY